MGLLNFLFPNAAKIVTMHKATSFLYQRKSLAALQEHPGESEAVCCAAGVVYADIFIKKIFKDQPHSFFRFVSQLSEKDFVILYEVVIIWFIQVHLSFGRIIMPDLINKINHEKLIGRLNEIFEITEEYYNDITAEFNRSKNRELTFFVAIARVVGADSADILMQKLVTTASGESYNETIEFIKSL